LGTSVYNSIYKTVAYNNCFGDCVSGISLFLEEGELAAKLRGHGMTCDK
jgi:hypothetical protein